MNNKGFAFSTILYGLLIVSVLIIFMIMALMSTNRSSNRKLVDQINEELVSYGITDTWYYNSNTFKTTNETAGYYKIELWGSRGSSNGNFYSSIVELQGDKEYSVSINNNGGSSAFSGNGVNIVAAGNNGTNSASNGSFQVFSLNDVNSGNGKIHIKRVSRPERVVTFHEGDKYNEGTYYIRNEAKKFLTVEGTSLKYKDFTGEDSQKFEVRKISTEKDSSNSNKYIIISALDGKILQLKDTLGTENTDIVLSEKMGVFYNQNNAGYEPTFDELEKWFFEANGNTNRAYIKAHINRTESSPTEFDIYLGTDGDRVISAGTNASLRKEFEFIYTY